MSRNSAWNDRFAVHREVVGSEMGCFNIHRFCTGPRAYICDMQVHEANETDTRFDLFHHLGIRDRKGLA